MRCVAGMEEAGAAFTSSLASMVYGAASAVPSFVQAFFIRSTPLQVRPAAPSDSCFGEFELLSQCLTLTYRQQCDCVCELAGKSFRQQSPLAVQHCVWFMTQKVPQRFAHSEEPGTNQLQWPLLMLT